MAHPYYNTFPGVYATSRHIPGVRFAGVSHPGLIGTAPSAELLATWNKREGELIAAHTNALPAVAFPPEPKGAYVGQDLPDKVRQKIAKEGARTVPGREHGGNCDVSCLLRRAEAISCLFVSLCRSRTSLGYLHAVEGPDTLLITSSGVRAATSRSSLRARISLLEICTSLKAT